MQLGHDTRVEVEEVAALISAVDPRLNQAIKWGRLTFAVEGNWHHWLCGIAVTKKTSNLVFHKGALLEDPEGLLRGTGQYVRQLPLATVQERPDAVTQLVRSAIEHETDSTH
jgi:hypothetical protein